MTKNPALKSFNGKSKLRTTASWKQHGLRAKWRSFVGVFILIILVFATINGLLKSFSIKKYLGNFNWDSHSSFVVALATSPPSIFIYQNDPKRMVFLTVPNDFYFGTGKFSKPLETIGEIVSGKDGQELSRVATLNFRTSIEKYAVFKDVQIINKDEGKKLFKNFASIVTPFAILAGFEDVKTNITRAELLSLWWQVKGLSVDRLKLRDLSNFSEEVVVSDKVRVLGADEQSFSRAVKEYLENRKVVEEEFRVKIQNASGTTLSSSLAVDLASSVGFDVIEVENAKTRNEKTIILAKDRNSYGARLLAKIFNCDILSTQTKDIAVVLGQDFALRYFE